MVGIQIGREQEEGEREDDAGSEKIADFNVTSNAEEKFAEATMTSADHVRHDGGEEREEEVQSCIRACYRCKAASEHATRASTRKQKGSCSCIIV